MSLPVRYHIGRARLELVVGNIVEETSDAIVNAANSHLLGGGGVDGAIHKAAGPQLLEECKKIRAQRGPLSPGHAVATPGANLAARYVIHTVGPVWQGGDKNEPQILESCYCNCLSEANRLACLSVSFPSISTGAFGYPVEDAAVIALRAVADHLHRRGSVLLARFVLFDQRTHRAYAAAAGELAAAFPHFEIRTEVMP
jgi:O-acetyl-ADP-ribose deacetylase